MGQKEGNPISADQAEAYKPIIVVNPHERCILEENGFSIATFESGKETDVRRKSFALDLSQAGIPLFGAKLDDVNVEELLARYRAERAEQIGEALSSRFRIATSSELDVVVNAFARRGLDIHIFERMDIVTSRGDGFDVTRFNILPGRVPRGGLRGDISSDIQIVRPDTNLERAAILPVLATTGSSFLKP